MGFAVENTESQDYSFLTILGRSNYRFFEKIQNTVFLGPLCSNMEKKEFNSKTGFSPFLDIEIIKLQAKNQKKLMTCF